MGLMKKPGILITNVVAFERKSKRMTGNIPAGKYNVEWVRTIREYIGKALAKTPAVRSVTYDIKAVMKTPRPGAIIMYKLETLRQQVSAECVGCVVEDDLPNVSSTPMNSVHGFQVIHSAP